MDSSGDFSGTGEGGTGVDSGVAVGDSEGLGGGVWEGVVSVPDGVFCSQPTRRRPANAIETNVRVFIQKKSTHGSAGYSR